jgi:hypothetical protein
MVERRFDDPQSMIGITAEELLAMKPDGWLVRPHPPGHDGFRMISPGKLPGGYGSISWHGPTPGFLRFEERPEPRLWVLNQSLEAPSFADLLRSWIGDCPSDPREAAAGTDLLARASEFLVAKRWVVVFEDPLEGDSLKFPSDRRAVDAIRDPMNWWRSEEDPSVVRARSVFLLDVTDPGRSELAGGASSPRRRGSGQPERARLAHCHRLEACSTTSSRQSR